MRKTLLPFAPTPHPLKFEVDFQISANQLTIAYYLTGATNHILFLDQSPSQSDRADELWKSTCFEWFLKSSHSKKYWEFNVAPTGRWNFYELDDYRTNLQRSALIETPRFSAHQRPDAMNSYQFKVEANLKNLFEKGNELVKNGRFAVTSVIQWISGEVSYFSLKHPSNKPDFHSNDGFTISLSEEQK
jgi:hypothetical protein